MRRLLWRWTTTTTTRSSRFLCSSPSDSGALDKVCSILLSDAAGSPPSWSELTPLNLELRPGFVSSVLRKSSDTDALFEFFQWAQQQDRFHHEPAAYEAMLEALRCLEHRGDRRLERVEWLLEQVLLKCRNLSSGLVNSLVDALVASGHATRAVDAFARLARARKPNIALCNAVFGSLLRIGDYKLAAEILRLMNLHACYPDDGTFRLLIDASDSPKAFDLFSMILDIGRVPSFGLNRPLLEFLCRAASAREVCRVAELVTRGTVFSDIVACNSILNGFRVVGKCRDAEDFLQRARERGISPDDISYRILVLAHCRSGEMDRALELLNAMRGVVEVMDVRTCNIVVDALCKAGRVDDAAELVHGMMELGPFPDVVTCNSLLDGLFKTGKVTHGMQLFAKMTRGMLQADAFTYNILLHGLCAAGRINEACQQLSVALRESRVRHECLYDALVGGLCKAGKIDHAMAVFRKMKRPSLVSYNIVIASCVKRRRCDAAVALFREMKAKERVPDIFTYNLIVRALAESARLEQALELVEKMIRAKCLPDRLTLGVLVPGLCKAGRTSDAEKLVREAGSPPDVVTLTALIRGQLMEGRVEDAMALFERMERSSSGCCKPNLRTINVVVHGLCKAGKVGQADALVRRMERDLGLAPDEFTFNTIIDGHFKAGDACGASELFREMTKLGRNRCAVTLNTAVLGLCRAGEADSAAALVRESATSRRATVVMYNAVIAALARSGRWEASMKLFREMPRSGVAPDAVTFTTLIGEACRQRRVDDAAEFVREMAARGSCRAVPLPYNMVLNALAKSGAMHEAGEMYKDMKARGVPRDVVTYNTLLDGYYRAGRGCDAYRVAREMWQVGVPPDTLSFNALLGCLCGEGRLREALAAFRGEMRERRASAPDAVTYALLVRYCCKAGEVGEACSVMEEMLRRGVAPAADTAAVLEDALRACGDVRYRLCAERLERSEPVNAPAGPAVVNGQP